MMGLQPGIQLKVTAFSAAILRSLCTWRFKVLRVSLLGAGAQWVGGWPIMQEALGSIPST